MCSHHISALDDTYVVIAGRQKFLSSRIGNLDEEQENYGFFCKGKVKVNEQKSPSWYNSGSEW